MGIGVLLIIGVVVVAAALMMLVGNEQDAEVGAEVLEVSPHGLELDSATVPWSSVFEVTVLTRRELRRTWFGFDIRAEGHGLLALDGARGPGQAFLAECHRFPGFDHARLAEALTRSGAREVCFSR